MFRLGGSDERWRGELTGDNQVRSSSGRLLFFILGLQAPPGLTPSKYPMVDGSLLQHTRRPDSTVGEQRRGDEREDSWSGLFWS